MVEQPYNIFDMNVAGDVLLTVSITYITIVGKCFARDSVIIWPKTVQRSTFQIACDKLG